MCKVEQNKQGLSTKQLDTLRTCAVRPGFLIGRNWYGSTNHSVPQPGRGTQVRVGRPGHEGMFLLALHAADHLVVHAVGG